MFSSRLLLRHSRLALSFVRAKLHTISTSLPPPPNKIPPFVGFVSASGALALSSYAGYAYVSSDDGKVEFHVRDIESDKALWALYKRWCRFHGIRRTPEEMQQRLEFFKKRALLVHETNAKNLPYRLGLTKYADELPEEHTRKCLTQLFEEE